MDEQKPKHENSMSERVSKLGGGEPVSDGDMRIIGGIFAIAGAAMAKLFVIDKCQEAQRHIARLEYDMKAIAVCAAALSIGIPSLMLGKKGDKRTALVIGFGFLAAASLACSVGSCAQTVALVANANVSMKMERMLVFMSFLFIK